MTAIFFAIACGPTVPPSGDTPVEPEGIRELLQLPDHLEVPAIPEYNPLTAEKIELGRHLFYDERLSGNSTQACADCHFQHLAFSDGLRSAVGSTGEIGVRNVPGIANVAWFTSLTWAHDGLLELEDQILVPLDGIDPVELGINDANEAEVLARFDADAAYVARFAAAFPESDSGATIEKVSFALASFCRSLVSGDSPYDRYVAGDRDALTEQQKLGLSLFEGEKLECFHCHGGINATISYRDWQTSDDTIQYPFFNTGLYDIDGTGSYPATDQGLHDVTLDPDDRGLFRPQSLRNVALTAPYAHDGSVATLEDVLRNYAAGGRVTAEGATAGDGRFSPLKSGLVRGFDVTDDEIDAVIAFLESLTDETFLTDPRFSDPEP